MRRISSWSLALVLVALCPVASVRGAAPAPYRPDGDTVLLYHFNETNGVAADASTNNYNGTVGSKVVRGTNGMAGFGTAYNFASNTAPNGVTTATIADGAVLSPFNLNRYTNGFTIEAWVHNVRTNGTGSTRGGIASLGCGNSRQADLFVDIGKIQFYDSSGKLTPVSAVLSWDTNLWYHLAVVFSINGANATCTVYRTPAGTRIPVQVAQQSTTTWGGFPTVVNSYFWMFGCGYGDANRSLGGDMDEVRFSGVPRTKFDTLSMRGVIIGVH